MKPGCWTPPHAGSLPAAGTPREERIVDTKQTTRSWTRGLVILAITGMALGLLTGDAAARGRDKEDRQVRLMERIFDDMLVESPNWLVQSRDETRGRYKKGEGAEFTFDADLVHSGYGKFRKWSWFGNGFHFEFDDDDEDYDDDRDRESRKERREQRERMEERSLKKQERLYSRGKSEIVETLLDFGDVMTVLGDDEKITVEVYLDDADLFYEKDIRTLTVSAKMSDLRAYAAGSLSEEDTVKRIEVVEE
jgi:hypothetical protein